MMKISRRNAVIVFTVLILAFILAFVFVYMSDDGGYKYSDENITLGYVPDGMELISSEKTRRTYFICFADNDDYFNINIGTLSSVFSIDTENGYSENIYIRGNIEAAFVGTSRINTLMWAEDESSYVITGNIPKDEMIRIAENVNR